MPTAPLICIVDDADDYRFLLKRLFDRHFSAYTVFFFADGLDFLDELPQLEQLPSLIVLDRHMPSVDGYQTLLQLKEHSVYRKVPVVMMSAAASSGEINGCYEAGANSFLDKPLGLDSLREQFELICQYWLELNKKPVEAG